MARIRSLALLSDEIDQGSASVEMTDNAIEATIESPMVASAEVADNTLQMEMDDVQLEEAAGDSEVLEEVSDVLSEGVDNGEALSPVAAECIRILASHIASKHGVNLGGINIARESFKGKSSALHATRMAMEGFSDVAKNIWKQIVKAYERVIEFFKKWWNKFFDGATKLRDRADALEKACKGKTEKISKAAERGDKIDLGDWGQHLQTKAGTIDFNLIKTISAEIDERYQTSSLFISDSSTSILTLAENALSNPNFSTNSKGRDAKEKELEEESEINTATINGARGMGVNGKIDPYIKKLVKELVDIKTALKFIKLSKLTEKAYGEQPEGTELMVFDLEIGGKVLICRFIADGSASLEEKIDAISHIKVWIAEAVDFKDIRDTEFALTGVNAADLGKCASGVRNMAIEMIKNKTDASKLEAQAKKIKDRAAKLAGYVHDDSDRQDEIRMAGNVARASISMCSSAQAQIRSYFLTTGNAVCSFIQAVLSNNKTADKKDMTKAK